MKKVIAILLVVLVAFSLFANGNQEKQAATTVSSTPKKGGVLHIAVKGDASSMLSWRLRGPIDRAFGCVIFEKLFNFDANGNPVPELLDSFEQDPSKLTYTFHVKKGVKFHDGSDLNAEVVKWNLDTYKAKGAQSASFLGNMESVEVVDEYTCVMHLSAWDALIPFYMAREGGCGYIQSKLAYETYGEEWCKENAVTTGPFKFVSWKHDGSVVLERNDNYWRGEVLLDGIQFDIYQEEATIQAAFLTGDVQAMMNGSVEMAEVLESQGLTVSIGGIPANCYTIAFESANPASPFHDLRVRQAACYALNRDDIANNLLGKYGASTTQYAKKGSTYYNDTIEGYPMNVQKAKELMKEAGYEKGFNTVIWLNSTSAQSLQLAQILVEQLSAINIKAEIKPVDNAAYTKLIDGWTEGIIIHGMGMDAGVAPQIAGSYKDGLTSGIGLHSFNRPANLGKVISEGLASDNDGLIAKFKEAQKIIFQDACLLEALAVSFPITITSSRVHDAEFGATVSTSANVWDAWLD